MRRPAIDRASCKGTRAQPVTDLRRILILNWRDLTHPRAGGAERVTHEIARRWAAWGHQVTLFCASYQGAAPEEVLDRVRVVRRGRHQTVHWKAYQHYRTHFQGRCDIIIDEVNTIPFFTPLYAREPVIMYSNQLARDVWRYEAPFPLSALGYIAEPIYLQVYRRTPVMTISQSTQNDLQGLGLPGPYFVLPRSVDTKPWDVLPSLATKEQNLTLVFVGRVVPSKRVDHMVRALGLVHRSGLVQARLWIVGSWDEKYRRALDLLIADLGLESHVTFFGHVDTTMKEQFVARAHVFVMTSVREGWGLVVTEANALGTPAAVYNVPGLRDSTRDGQTGLVCQRNTPSALAHAIVSLHAQPLLYARLREQAWLSVNELSWDRTARSAWAAVESCL